MSKKRTSKKLLVGLGTVISFGAMSVSTSFGIKSILDSSKEKFIKSDSDLLIPKNNILPNLNIATEDMFINTENLNFHLGNSGIGQASTPFGWLGTYTKKSNANKYGPNTLTLTNWDGQILWVNNENNEKIYDAKYNNITKQIFVVRGDDPSGTKDMKLTIHDVFTGELLSSSNIKDVRLSNIIPASKAPIDWNDERQKYSAYQDFVTLQNGDTYWYYQFDFNKYKDELDTKYKGAFFVEFLEKKHEWNKISDFKVISTQQGSATSVRDLNFNGSFIFEEQEDYERKKFSTFEINPYLTVVNNNKLFINWVETSKKTINEDNGVYDYGLPVLMYKEIQLDKNSNLINTKHETVKQLNVTNFFKFDNEYFKKNYTKNQETIPLTRPIRNMFKQNFITFPYLSAYSYTNKTPLYSVTQLNHSESNNVLYTVDNDSRSMEFNLAEQILFDNNGSRKKDINDINDNLYNPILTISPFDGTIIFKAKPDFILQNGNENIFDNNPKYKNWYSSLWIALNDTGVKQKPYHSIVVPNNEIFSNKQKIDTELLSKASDLYNNIALDFKSSVFNTKNGVNLSLYFPQTGSKMNKEGDVLKTSKICILDIKNTKNGWTSRIDNSIGSQENSIYEITSSKSSYGYLNSMVDLEKWYPSSWTNLSYPSNTIKDGIRLNGTRKKHLSANKINESLISTEFLSLESTDLVSNYLDTDYIKNSNLKRPEITKVKRTGQETNQQKFDGILNLEIKYESTLTNENIDFVPIDKKQFTFKKNIQIKNASKEIFTSLEKHVKIKKMMGSSNAPEFAFDYGNPTGGDYNSSLFGSQNNALLSHINGLEQTNALRVELQIYLDNNNQKEFFQKVPEKFKQSYPLNDFNKILQEFIDWKTKNVMFNGQENTHRDDLLKYGSLNSLSIKVHLKLNPEASIATKKEIYTLPNSSKTVLKVTNQNQFVIYNDKYSNNRLIYDQSSLEFEEGINFGWSGNINHNLYSALTPGTNINTNSKFLIDINSSLMKNDLLGQGIENLFEAKFDNNFDLIVAIKNEKIKNNFKEYNKMLGLILEIEGQKNDGSWIKLKSLSDKEIKSVMTSDGELTLGKDHFNVSKIRFRLRNISDTNPNLFVHYNQVINENDRKFISDEVSVKSKNIQVDHNWLNNTKLILPENKFLNELTQQELIKMFNDYKSSVLSNLNSDISSKVTVKFKYEENDKYLTSEEIAKIIYQNSHNYDDNNLGIVSLWNGENGDISGGVKINAKFFLMIDDGIKIIGVDNGKIDDNLNTENISTKINLKNFVDFLEREKTTIVGTSDNVIDFLVPNMKGDKGSDFLSGQPFEHIIEVLSKFDIKIQYNSIDWNGQNNWVNNKNEIKTYDPSKTIIAIRFIQNKQNNIKLSIDGKDILQLNTSSRSILLPLLVPKLVTIPKDLITNFINSNPASGTTKYLEIDKTKELKLLEEIKDYNLNISSDFSAINLKIKYQLGNSSWLERDNLVQFLSEQKNDQITNELQFKFELLNEPTDFYIDKKEEMVLVDHKLTKDALIKIFINNGEFLQNISKFEIVGTNEDYEIINLQEWYKTIPKGLNIRFSADEDPASMDEPNFVDYPNLPKPLNKNRKLWINFKVQDGYVAEFVTYNGRDNWLNVDTSNLKTIINLKSEFLNLIQLEGNTKNIKVNENPVLQKIKNDNLIPDGKENLIVIEYTFDEKEWFKKDKFIEKLLQLDGGKDKDNFIIKREDIKARFILNEDIDVKKEYVLNIDSVNVSPDNLDLFIKNLVSDTLNIDFKGYININKLDNFTVDNFSIRGSNTNPRIKIQNYDILNNLLNIYASDDIFEIRFATTMNNGKPDYSNKTYQLWNPSTGGLIDENGLIQLGATLSANKTFYIGFFAKNEKYEVYNNSTLQQNGYSLDISKNVAITIEIENPFEFQNLTLGLWFRNLDKTPKFYQNYGGFRISTVDSNGNNNYQNTAQQFLQNSNLTDSEKNALELVYTTFNGLPDDNEMNEILSPTGINNYGNSGKWKKIPIADNLGFIDNLNLKVDQYVFVGLRVKREFAQVIDGGFSLKNDKHSISKTEVSRVNGLKVKVDKLNINWNDLVLINALNPLQDPLDGFSIINKLALKSDTDNNYLGVDLKLNLFNEFWENNDGPIILNSNIKLVKRNSNGSQTGQGNYKDSFGKDILDKNNNPIPILIDKKGLPTPPIEKVSPTNSIKLVETNLGTFTFLDNDNQLSKFSLFRNQKIQIEYVGKKGDSKDDLFDYYLDDLDNNKVDHVMDNKIKFPLDNSKSISYKFDLDILNNLKYENAIHSNLNPITGQSKLVTPLAILRTDASEKVQKISGTKALEDMLKNDFGSLLKFQIHHITIDGLTNIYDSINISQINTLKNGDRLIVNIVAKDENDYIFSEGPDPFVILASGLFEKSPEKELLQYLRVEQNGSINGKGSFNVLINNPNNDLQTSDTLLLGYKFALRVWDSNKSVKIDWTTNQDKISNLSNGDRIEWKLVTDKNQPVTESYYNTISNGTKQKLDGSIDYIFSEINGTGNNIPEVVNSEIGVLPNNNIYPEKSGFTIDGLKNTQDQSFTITDSAFNKIISQLDAYYVGINGSGSMKFACFDNLINQDNLYVTNIGEIIDKTEPEFILRNRNTTLVQEIKLIDFIKQIEFISKRQDESNINKFIEMTFNYSSNDTNIDNKLSNNDLISAIFNNGDGSKTLLSNFSTVKNLLLINDPVNPLWYVLFGGATIVTLGLFALIYIKTKNKKIK